jgi:CO/xanthine dehydrogenase Mo-binding subunit
MADHIVSTETEASYAQHVPIEPHVCLSYLDPQGRLVLRTSTQVPFHCRRIIAQCLQIPVGQIRVIKPRVGGGFGTKQEILLEDICGLATLRTGRPVKWEFTRSEEFYAGRTRHPIIVAVKMGVTKKGEITALDMKALSNTGAYGTHSLTVLTNAGSKILPLYRSANYRFDGDAVYTNMPVGGAYRGYGGTQGAFAMETLIDELCEKTGFDPIDFRKRSHIQVGESSPVWAAMGEGKSGVPMTLESCGLDDCIDAAEKWMKFRQKRKRYSKERESGAEKRRGVGVACLMQGSGIPLIDMGSASIKMNEDGSFNLHVGATDIGTGSDTVLAQIAAEVLHVETKEILVTSSDTDITPFDVGAYASSTTYISGGAVKKAAEDCLATILEVAGEMLGADSSLLELGDRRVIAPNGRQLTYDKIIKLALYSNKQRQIMGQGSHFSHSSPPPFACHMAEVEVDTETGEVHLLSYVAACDCGVAINPKLAEGQVEGAVMNGVSYALTEQFVFDRRGEMLNANLNDYRIWSSLDAPHLQTILIPTHEPTGPFGAKSVAEININGPIPAISNAIANATGLRMKKTPFHPEAVLSALGLDQNPARLLTPSPRSGAAPGSPSVTNAAPRGPA